jgi:hypothetical protein
LECIDSFFIKLKNKNKAENSKVEAGKVVMLDNLNLIQTLF